MEVEAFFGSAETMLSKLIRIMAKFRFMRKCPLCPAVFENI